LFHPAFFSTPSLPFSSLSSSSPLSAPSGLSLTVTLFVDCLLLPLPFLPTPICSSPDWIPFWSFLPPPSPLLIGSLLSPAPLLSGSLLVLYVSLLILLSLNPFWSYLASSCSSYLWIPIGPTCPTSGPIICVSHFGPTSHPPAPLLSESLWSHLSSPSCSSSQDSFGTFLSSPSCFSSLDSFGTCPPPAPLLPGFVLPVSLLLPRLWIPLGPTCHHPPDPPLWIHLGPVPQLLLSSLDYS
jgi:hypothetical protein